MGNLNHKGYANLGWIERNKILQASIMASSASEYLVHSSAI